MVRPEGYLWPRTPTANIQAEIWRRVGASDYNLLHPDCRAVSILKLIDGLIDNELLGFRFDVLDLCCGDAVILWQIARAYPGARCRGVDLLEYPEHAQAREAGVDVRRVSLQSLVKASSPVRYDLALMLNTWRGWDRAGLSEADAGLPAAVERWLIANARYVVVTATAEQVEALKARGWWVFDIGRGEDDSRMVCMFWSGAR